MIVFMQIDNNSRPKVRWYHYFVGFYISLTARKTDQFKPGEVPEKEYYDDYWHFNKLDGLKTHLHGKEPSVESHCEKIFRKYNPTEREIEIFSNILSGRNFLTRHSRR